jgi:DNA-directed RNA polymerase subunit RPC12/RpoP
MVKIRIACPACGTALQSDEGQRGKKIKCPHCKELIFVPPFPPGGKVNLKRRRPRRNFVLSAGLLVLFAAVAVAGIWVFNPVRIHWPDRRPIGELFLASDYYSSVKNPRGWFNDPNLDVTGPGGTQRFRKALLDYTDRSIANLKRTGAQGVIVWDLEGEQFPHKITYIGDPRLLDRLAPEMSAVADEFFGRLRGAGLKVGMTIRPQQFTLVGPPRQTQVLDIKRILMEKIDYAKARWGATIFYIDSNGGIRRPDEAAQLRSLAEARPDVLLIPEHHYLPYWEFSAPYVALRKGDAAFTGEIARQIFPGAFEALDISDASDETAKITAAWFQGDILLFRAWYWGPECQILEELARQSK